MTLLQNFVTVYSQILSTYMLYYEVLLTMVNTAIILAFEVLKPIIAEIERLVPVNECIATYDRLISGECDNKNCDLRVCVYVVYVSLGLWVALCGIVYLLTRS